MSITQYDLKLTLRSPFLIPATQIAAWGHDVSQMSNDKGHALIPGDLIKGLMRHAIKQLEQHCAEAEDGLEIALFGQRPTLGEEEQQQRSRVSIADLEANEGPDLDQSRHGLYTRVHIDRETGAAETGHLQFAEQRYAPGREVLFKGTLSLCADAERYLPWLKKALDLIPAVGANKSCGYGEVISAELIEKVPTANSSVDLCADIRSLYIKITFDRPLLVDSQRIAENLFRSSRVIPGSVIKGAFAASLSAEEQQTFSAALSAIRFGFAHAKYDGQFNFPPLPLSLMLNPLDETGKQYFDAARYTYPDNKVSALLINDEVPARLSSAKHAVKKAALALLNRPQVNLPGEVRVRTAINLEHNSADNGSLFSYDMIKPGDGKNSVAWYARIDSNGVDAAFTALMGKLLTNGLIRVGKTEAMGTVEQVKVDEVPALAPPLSAQANSAPLIIQLATPALMIDPDAQVSHGGLQAHYQRYWDEVAPDMTLRQIFTQERMIGSFTAYTYRFREQQDYHPYLLTEAGSVFVFDPPNGDDPPPWLSAALKKGLPLPEWVVHRSFNEETKRIDCPFMPENGYGEILIDPASALSLPSPEALGVHHV